MLEYMKNILYFSYISYFVDIVIFSTYGLIINKSPYFVFTLNSINMDLYIVNK
jgi:hypothetical protein